MAKELEQAMVKEMDLEWGPTKEGRLVQWSVRLKEAGSEDQMAKVLEYKMVKEKGP